MHEGKLSAIRWFDFFFRNTELARGDSGLGMVHAGYKRLRGAIQQKGEVCIPMLLSIRQILPMDSPRNQILWGTILTAFFFLERAGEMWHDNKITNSPHVLLFSNMRLLDTTGTPLTGLRGKGYTAVELCFRSSKADT